MAIFLDQITITTDPDFLPSNDIDQYMLTQNAGFQQEQGQGELTLQFAPGSYSCYAEAFNTHLLVDAFGYAPLRSNTINFVISP